MTTYDIVLVHALSRVHNHYLNVVRHLGGRLRIGIYVAQTKKAVKTPQTEALFLDLCRQFGAEILDEGPHACGLLAVPQFPYREDFLPHLLATVKAGRRVALQTFGHGTENLGPLSQVGIERLYVYDRGVFENKLKTPEQRRFVDERWTLIEMGFPAPKYPAFELEPVDYLLAFPTDLSFVNGRAKARFLANVHSLLDQIPDDRSVVLKLHNVSDGGRLGERMSRAFRLGRGLGSLGLRLPILGLPGRPGEAVARMAFGARYQRLVGRTRALAALTPYFNLGLELFLPSVRRGLITGRSAVVWYALVRELPVYNCDDETVAARGEGVLDYTRAFGVDPCHGRLAFDPAAFERVSESARQADLLELIQKEL